MAGVGWLFRAGRLLRVTPRIWSRGKMYTSSAGRGGAGGVGYTQVSELDKADAWLLRKAHETGFLSWFRNGLLATGIGVISYVQSDMGQEAAYGFLSWFRNGLLATGIGVISYVQSDMGQEAAYGFFILGGVCMSYGSASYLANLVLLRRTMMLSFSAAMLSGAAVLSLGLFWVCAVSLYIGRLEVEIVRDDTCEKCRDQKDDGKSEK
ncbi:transmembrane protein 160 [Ambystoma mexicanum]|uniref:transmembrane protein 160 n=1 Tax=Ambystoma mexicanum TaxID=8296 RepID=UPI0037E7F7AC